MQEKMLDREEIEIGEEKECSVIYIIFSYIIGAAEWLLKFSFFIITKILGFIIKVLEALFLQDFELFGSVTDYILERRATKKIRNHEIKYATEYLTRHEYVFERSQLYSDTYKEIQEKFKDFADNNVTIDRAVYVDLLEKIAVLTVETEKKALEEGYNYASYTKYMFSSSEHHDEIYNSYIEYKIMRGEGRGKVNKK